MKKAVGAGILAVGLTFLFSGCFAMRTLTFTKDTVQAGEKTKALISVIGDTADTMRARGVGDEFPFFYFFAEGGSTVTNGGVFDTKGLFDGPVALKKNNGLAELTSESCEEGLPFKQGPPSGAEAVTTEEPFVATNQRKFMDAELPIRASEVGNGDAFGIFMGTWTDDGDGVPEDEDSTDDDYVCQPPYFSAIRIKGGEPVR